MSKIGKMKAIHNERPMCVSGGVTVVTLSKIGKMKAIHNPSMFELAQLILL